MLLSFTDHMITVFKFIRHNKCLGYRHQLGSQFMMLTEPVLTSLAAAFLTKNVFDRITNSSECPVILITDNSSNSSRHLNYKLNLLLL
jgi:hypothetical protein